MPEVAASERVWSRLCRRQRTDTPEAAVRGAVAELLRRLGVTRPPVSLRPILDDLGIEFRWTDRSFRPGTGSATLEVAPGGYRIAVHERAFRRQWRRARFTVAHEVLHALLYSLIRDPELIRSLDENESDHRQLERLCNLGAAELLAPSHWLRHDLRGTDLAPASLLRLYDRYLVSQEVLTWKVAEVLPRGAVVRWRRHARNEREAKCWRVVRTYPRYDRAGGRPWLPTGATLRHVSMSDDEFEVEALPHVVLEVEVVLKERKWTGSGVVSCFPSRAGEPLPLFEGLAIPDDNARPEEERLMFLVERAQGSGSWSPVLLGTEGVGS